MILGYEARHFEIIINQNVYGHSTAKVKTVSFKLVSPSQDREIRDGRTKWTNSSFVTRRFFTTKSFCTVKPSQLIKLKTYTMTVMAKFIS